MFRAKEKTSSVEMPLRDHEAVGRSSDFVYDVAGPEKGDSKELLAGGGWERGHMSEWISPKLREKAVKNL